MRSNLRQKLLDIMLRKKTHCLFISLCGVKNQTELLDIVADCLNKGVDIIELSGHSVSDNLFFDTAKKAKELCEIYNATFIIRGRADIAYLTSADCVNLEQDSIDIHSVRKIIGEKVLIGIYMNDAELSDKYSVKDGADYVFNIDTKSTPNASVKITDLEYAKWVSENTHIPVLKFVTKDQTVPQIQ